MRRSWRYSSNGRWAESRSFPTDALCYFGVFGPQDTVTAVAVTELVVSPAGVFAEEG
jgi:hypothetical protein